MPILPFLSEAVVSSIDKHMTFFRACLKNVVKEPVENLSAFFSSNFTLFSGFESTTSGAVSAA